ncbi:PREDICTED: MATH and LRR domain-containing protein PFE0570w-like isoform X2 [Polistes dominula]|uniref:MATH and LRR domain-containing protein PFE0570w-like isoform X2 n=1 Tax=Polistes dominula TaxID=743375 RepID=A0ABM1IX42_POLDO|nr:PREDICTED: MATH and LRR domain-containing protein PFE0570w-like isoform X2 [Polistes dominula]
MLHSKATAALMRLKEIDKKYKMRTEERYEMNSSTENAITSPSVEEYSIKDKPKLNDIKIPLKSKLDVRMPKTHVEMEQDEKEEEEEEEGTSRSTIKDEVSSTIVVDIQTKSAENISEELFNNVSFSMIETNENISTKSEEKEVSQTDQNESIEIEENKEEILEKEVENMEDKNKEIIVENSLIDSEYSNSKILSEIEEYESLHVEQAVNYVNDTFEEASSTTLSTMKSNDDLRGTNNESSNLEEEEEKIEDSMRSGVKKVDIVLNKDFIRERQEIENASEKQIVELVPPKLIENTSECEIGLNKELSNYVKTIESINEDVSDITPVQLLRSSKQMETSFRNRKKKYKRHPIATKNDNATDSSKSDKSESLATSKNNRRSSNVTLINDNKKTDNLPPNEKIILKKNEQRNNEDKRIKLSDKDKDSIAMFSINDRLQMDNNLRVHQNKRKKKRMKSHVFHRSSRTDKTTDFNEDKFSRFDIKQMYRLQKQISKLVAGLCFNDTPYVKQFEPILFKPLEFPNIANYTRPDTSVELTKENPYIELYEKLATIRHWLKDQYSFYQVRSNLIQIINEKYVPMSLEDAKTVIRQLQKSPIETR